MHDDLTETMEEARIFYLRGNRADVLQARRGGIWGPFWTLPPKSATAMENAGRQLTRSRAERVRHIRRARFSNGARHDGMVVDPVEVVILTELPSLFQGVVRLADGQALRVAFCFSDDSLTALREAFTPSDL